MLLLLLLRLPPLLLRRLLGCSCIGLMLAPHTLASTPGDGCGDVRRLRFDPLWRSYTWGLDLPPALFRRGLPAVVRAGLRCLRPDVWRVDELVASAASSVPARFHPSRHIQLEDLQQLLLYHDPDPSAGTAAAQQPRSLLLGISGGGTVALWDYSRWVGGQ